MVQINLLPSTAKKKQKAKLELKISLAPVIYSLIALVVVIIVAWAILALSLSAQQRTLVQLDEQLKAVESTLQKLDKLKQEKELLTHKLEFLDNNLTRDVLWAENLNRLSNLMPPGVWLKSLVLHSQKADLENKYERLDINGCVISLYGKEMIDLIGEFMTIIKQDKVFAEQFSEIKLISSQRGRKTKHIEMMDFKLSCQFRTH